MVLNTAGIAAGWKVEMMPQARVMPELIQLPDMSIVIVNGAQTGVAGYGNVHLFFKSSERCNAESVTVYRCSWPKSCGQPSFSTGTV
jgi:hypothetical protein